MPLRHVVLLTFDESCDVDELVATLRELPAAIPELRRYVVGADAGLAEGNATVAVVADVDDEDVVINIQRLARTEGIFAETAGGVTVGVTAKLISDGVLDPAAETVVINSGDGLKTLDAVADRVGPSATIPPRYEAFTEFWKGHRA